jgi:hypothetical protein
MIMKLSVFFGCLTLLCAGSLYAGEAYEPPGELKASDILPEVFFNSELYKVEERVKNDGLMNTYTVTSPHGNFSVISTVALYKLIVEIEAIDAMKKVEASDTFTESLKASGSNTIAGIKNLFSKPEESIEGAAKGISSLWSRGEESVLHSDAGETEDSNLKQLIGFSKSKRDIAYKYHVDVYSTNKVLQDQLDTLAWADYAGGMTLSVATLPLGGAAAVVYSSANAVRLLNEAIAMTPPSELKRQNREKLAGMKMDANLSDLFINNPHFSPRQQTFIVAAMEAMDEAAHREVVLMVGLQVKDSDMAMAFTTIAMMQAGYNKNVARIKSIEPVMRIIGATDANGNRILLIPADHMTWNDRLAGAISAMGKQASNGTGQIWLLGTASELAQTKLKEKGWQVRTKVAGKIGINDVGLLKK